MTRLKLHELFGILALAIWTAGADFEQARAQESAQYPNRLIRIVAPLPAGGNMDALSRVIAENSRITRRIAVLSRLFRVSTTWKPAPSSMTLTAVTSLTGLSSAGAWM